MVEPPNFIDDLIDDFPGIVFRMKYSEEGAIFEMLGGDCKSFAGFSPDEARGNKKIFQKYIAAEDYALFHDLHTTPRNLGETLCFIFRFDHGGKIFWGFEKSRLVDVNHETGTYTYRGTIRDVTEKMKLKEVVQDTAAKSHFFAAMSHEIRTPLNAITGILYILGQTPLSPQQQHYLSILNKTSSTLLEIINEVLDFSKIKAGGMRIVKKPFDIEGLLNDVQAIFSPQALEKKIQFTVKLADNVPRKLFSDGFHIRQMLLNLVGNAFKFTSAGQISVHCALESRVGREVTLCFTVTDTGIGMEQRVLDNVFKPFVQANCCVSRRLKGTGLGLSIVKSLAEMLGGRVGVHSIKGQGSTFLFTCKATEVDICIEKNEHSPARVPAFFGHVVLLVEDNLINREIASFLLKNTGLRVEEAENGLEAVEKVKKDTNGLYSLILMDIQMPVMNGIEATRQIRALPGTSDIPIIAMTAHAFDKEIETCIRAGMNCHISKPLDIQEFYSVLAQYLYPLGIGEEASN